MNALARVSFGAPHCQGQNVLDPLTAGWLGSGEIDPCRAKLLWVRSHGPERLEKLCMQTPPWLAPAGSPGLAQLLRNLSPHRSHTNRTRKAMECSSGLRRAAKP